MQAIKSKVKRQQIIQELIRRWDRERELFTTTSYNTSKYNPLLNIQHDAGHGAASGCGLVVLVRRFSHAPICCNEVRFLANVNAIARPSVCRPTQAVQIFGNISTALGTLAIRELPPKFYGDRPRGTPPSGELNTTVVTKYSDFGPIEGYITETVQDRR